jgi:hypothetical protein
MIFALLKKNNILFLFNKKCYVLLIIITTALYLYTGFYHSIHISFGTAILQNHEFSGKVIFYKDDFFKALQNWKNKDFRNLSNDEYDELKKNYLKYHFTAAINDSLKLNLSVWGNNEDESSIWFYFKFESTEQIKHIDIKYDVLFSEFSNQMNLLNLTTPTGEQSLIFSTSTQEIKVQL